MKICNTILRGLSNILPTPLTCMRATPFYVMHSSVTPPPLATTSTINIKKNYYLSDITDTKAFFSFIKREFMAKLLYGFILHCTGLSKWPWSVYCIIWGETLSGGKTCGYEECISPYVTFHLINEMFWHDICNLSVCHKSLDADILDWVSCMLCRKWNSFQHKTGGEGKVCHMWCYLSIWLSTFVLRGIIA